MTKQLDKKKKVKKNVNVKKDEKFYKIKGKKKILMKIKPRKTIKKKYFGRRLLSKKKYVVKRKLRKSIEVGKIAIILAGKYMGKRCIITKILSSGLVAVIGPFEINGVPLRRIDSRYLIVTSTNIFDLDRFKKVKNNFINSTKKLNDNVFVKKSEIKKLIKKSLKKDSKNLFMNDIIKKTNEIRKSNPKVQRLQKMDKKISKLLIPLIKKSKLFKAYLKTKFTLRNDMILHKMKF